jgi:PAS domain S-box-containing protein
MDSRPPSIESLRRQLEKTRAAALAASSAEGPQVFAQLAQRMASLLEVGATMIATAVPHRPGIVRSRAAWLDGRLLAPFEYDVRTSPCRDVAGRQLRFVARGVNAEFAPGSLYQALGFDSYAARALVDGEGRPLGLIVAMDRRPLRDQALVEALMQIFAVRAAAELERERAEAALRTSEASYRAIFEANEVAVFVHDWDTGAILDVSPKATELYGHPREDLQRMRVGDISANVPPYTEVEAARLIQRAKVHSAAVRFEWRARHRDGRLMWHEVTLKRAEIAGQPRVLAFVRDITERKADLEQLQLREEQYRAIFDASADALVLWDARAHIVDVNPAFLRMYGFSREQIVGSGYPEHLPREYVAECRGQVRRALAGEPSELQTGAFRADGSPFHVELRVLPIRYRGEPHVLAIVRDITDRVQAEKALRDSEQQYRAIFNASADALVLRDAQFRIVDVNATYETMSGYRREEVLGVDRVIANPPEVAAAIRALHDRALAGEPITFDTPFIRRDGVRYDLELRGVPIQHRGAPHVLYLGRDITARKQAERQRAQLQAQLLQAQKMEAIGQLTGGIAHDFNNILASIMGYGALALERPVVGTDAKLAEHLEQVQQACRRARDLIRQMLTFSRGRRADPRELPLAPLIEESVRLLRPTVPGTIAVEVDPVDAQLTVTADPVQLQQVLLNLCINARDAVGDRGRIGIGARALTVEQGACASCGRAIRGGFIEIAVSDTGPGISAEARQHVFEPFFSTKAPGRGSGMGLATVHGIVHEHGGHVLLDSEPGQGARFRVLLPPQACAAAERSACAPERADPAAPPADPQRPSGRPPVPLTGRVLLVDDETSVLGFMQELLQNWGLEVVALCDPIEAARRCAHAERFDLVLTDLTMPNMNGVDLARAIHATRHDVPVILYSGHSEALAPEEAARAGICTVLRKPVEPTELKNALRQHLAARQTARS